MKPCSSPSMAMGGLLLAVLVSAASASFTNKMIGISEDLEKALQDVLDGAAMRYTEPDLNVTYLSTTEFNPQGMGHLYNMTEVFMDIIQKKQAYPEGLLEVRGGHLEHADLAKEWQTITTHYVGIIAVVVIATLFGLMLPIIGLCFYVCRCAGKCGGKRQTFDKKYDKCKKGLLSILLICLATLFILGLVSLFVTNERVHHSVKELPNKARVGVKDTYKYLNTTHSHVHTLLNVNYQELQTNLLSMIRHGGAKVSDQLAEFSKAASVTTLNTMVESLSTVKGNLINMRRVTNALRANASQLDDGLRRVKNELLHTLERCPQKQCKEILNKYKIGELDASGIDFSQLPDVSQLLDKVSSLIDGNIQEEVKEGQKVFNNIKTSIESSVNEHLPVLISAIENAGVEINQFSSKIDKVFNNAKKAVKNSFEPNIDYSEQYLVEYGEYRWYFDILVCALFLIILFEIVMGLLCGICGRRRDAYSNDCCDKGSGSRSLLCASCSMFMFSILLISALLVHFLIGVVLQRGICEPLKNPKDDQMFKLMDDFVGLEQTLFRTKDKNDFNMSYVVTKCHQNKTIYEVLRLDKIVNLDELKKKSEKELSNKINDVYQKISFDQRNFVILKDSAKEKLVELSESGLSDFPFDRFTEVLVTNITSIDLSSLAKQLHDTAEKISNKPEFEKVMLNLKNQALFLETYQQSLVNPMIREVENLNDTAIALRDGLKFNHSSFKEAVLSLIKETKDAEKYLSVQGPEAIKNLTRVFASNIAGRLSDYLGRVVSQANDDIGQCGPMSKVYNASLTATCASILLPFNGFWFAGGWCILLFIPLIIVCVKLAGLYAKTDPYPGPLVEAEYLYDAYADRDNIPLANSQHVEKLPGRGRRGDRSRQSGRPRSGDSEPRPSAPDATRFTDMAPKHWEDYPSGGPPRYHGPEYERPPPYYYPGPHNERA